MTKIKFFSQLPREDLKKIKKNQPTFIKPMLATLTNDYFSNKDWIYEQKFDGERCLVFKKNGKVTLKSRNKKIINNEYPELVEALNKQSADNFIIDGEIVALNKNGISDFQLLQGRINLRKDAEREKKRKFIPIDYYIFDVIYVDKYDIRNFPLLTRKKILKKMLNYKGILKYTHHRSPDGLKYFKESCKVHWEGLIAKKSDSLYVGKRSHAWLKFKCTMEQELIIIGYTDPKGSRTDLGALLLGYYKNKKLIYAGKVGTGFTDSVLKMLGYKLHKLRIKKCPAVNYDEEIKGVNWVKPELVAEFKFAEWTKANKLRVGRYKGLRDDKDAKDVVKETP